VPTDDVTSALQRFVDDDRLHRYAVDDDHLMQIVHWWDHQHPKFAQASSYEPPEGWVDRIKTRQNGTFVSLNWDSLGGFARTRRTKPSHEPLARTPRTNPPHEPLTARADVRAEGPKPEPVPEPEEQTLMSAPPAVQTCDDLVEVEEGSYSEDFEHFWEFYPRRQYKRAAWRCWQARIRKKVRATAMIAAARNYAAASSGTEQRWLMHGSRFIGRDCPFLDWQNGIPEGCLPDGGMTAAQIWALSLKMEEQDAEA
jgi:hypothetical protein